MKFALKTVGSVMAYAMAMSGVAAQAAPVGPGQVTQGVAIKAKGPFSRVVVIYEENHSFDNLYGGWDAVNGEPVNGRDNAPAVRTQQIRQDGSTYGCLAQNDVNLTSPPLSGDCSDASGTVAITSHFTNAPFAIEDYIQPNDTTCPAPGAFYAHGAAKGAGEKGGCTEDIVHRFYQEQYQIHDGHQDRYMTGSDSVGLVMGYYDTVSLPIYQYLHTAGAPNYIINDNFFQGAFGGSFLNHQWLVAAAAPVFAGALTDGTSNDFHSIVDSNGFPNASYPLYTPTSAVKDSMLTQVCPQGSTGTAPNGLACGDYAVNTTQPWYQPYSPGTADNKRLQPLSNKHIGDRLDANNVSWAWYSGGWSNANGDIGGPGWTNGNRKGGSCQDPNAVATATFPNCPDKTFQYHHQPLNYFADMAPGTPGRAHLRDEQEFIARAKAGHLPQVSFVKPLGIENEHPGYASETKGSSHLVDLIDAVVNGPQGEDTLIIVTYDEFGGQWDHAQPPGTSNNPNPHDQWGPGTRVPALLVSKKFTTSTVDHTSADTTSILTTIEQMFGLNPLGSRDAAVNSLLTPTVRKATK